MPILYSCHPRSRKKLEQMTAEGRFALDERVIAYEPMGFHDYNCLQMNAYCVVSDSGTLPEESSYFTSIGKPFPAVCIRTSTERPEALDKACFILSGISTEGLLQSVELAVSMNENGDYGIPVSDYIDTNVSSRSYQLLLKNDDVTIKSVVEEETTQGELSRRFRLVKQDDIIAFDHASLIVKAIIKLRDWIDTTGVGFELVPEKFTLTQLQQTYESVKGEKLLAPAFRRKIAKIVKETEDFENDGRDAHRPARLFVDGRKDAKNKNTPFCIVCGAEFKGDVKPSKEHIIPEALGNKKLITYNICEACNNAFGGNVDNYLTDYLIVKMIRMEHLEKDKEIRLFRGKMTDDRGDAYNITDNGPAVIPKMEIDKESGHIHMEVPDIEKGKEIARGVLKKDFGKNDSEIEGILADSRLFRVGEAQKKDAGVFKQNIDLDLSRFCLAAIKMAYEYAVEKLGEVYTTDEDAVVLRAYLKAGRDGKRVFSSEEADDILKRCHGQDAFTDIMRGIFEMYSNITCGRKIKYMIWICQDGCDQLLCGIRLLDEDVLSFTVFLSRNAKKYLKGRQGYTTFIFEDGSMYEP